MRTKPIHYATAAALVAAIALTGPANPTALADPAPVMPAAGTEAASALSATVDPSQSVMWPLSFTDVAQQMANAAAAGAAGALAAKATGFRPKASSGSVAPATQGSQDTQFDAPPN